jgi:hypothetical protein
VKRFQINDHFRIPWDAEFGETLFVVYETLPGAYGKQVLYAHDIHDEETIIGISSDEVLPV